MANDATKISKDLQKIAGKIDREIEKTLGHRVNFSLFVWTDGRANYVANTKDREGIKAAITEVVNRWELGMPDVPAHEVQ